MIKMNIEKKSGPDKHKEDPKIYEINKYGFDVSFTQDSSYEYTIHLIIYRHYHPTIGWVTNLPIITGPISKDIPESDLIDIIGKEIFNQDIELWRKNIFAVEILTCIDKLLSMDFAFERGVRVFYDESYADAIYCYY